MLPLKDRVRQAKYLAATFSILLGIGGSFAAWYFVPSASYRNASICICLVAALQIYILGTAKWRKRQKIISNPLPAPWITILKGRVAFYNALCDQEKLRFQKLVNIFINETRITGIDTEVDDACRVLVAASAIIPVFGFPDWEYSMLNEVLIYPNRFDGSHGPKTDDSANTLGMVGCTGSAFNGLMILSKHDLFRGFEIHGDKENVGVHEFAHLVDKGSGAIDGIPAGMPDECIGIWTKLVGQELEKQGDSDIPDYVFTNREEFLAVITEYFFESPKNLEKQHPEIYELLSKSFKQNPRKTFAEVVKKIFRPSRRRTGRNAPCPCGSGIKYKRCCLKKARKARKAR